MSVDLRLRHDRSLRERAVGMFERGLGYKSAARELGVPAEAVRNWQKTYRATGRDGLLAMGGRQARYDYETRVAAASAVVDGGMSKPEAMEALRGREPLAAEAVVPPVPRGRRGGARAQAEGQAEGVGREDRAEDPRAGARGARAQARGAGGVPKKIDSPEGGAALPRREKALAVAELSGLGHRASDLLEAAGLARSSYRCALARPKAPTRPELRPRVAEIFGRLPNGVGHRQIAMELRAVDGARVADKTVLKMMNEMGLRCGIRRETDYHRHNSYKGVVGRALENVLGRDFAADGPWQKTGPTSPSSSSPSAGPTSRRSTTSAARRSWRGRSRSARTSPSRRRC